MAERVTSMRRTSAMLVIEQYHGKPIEELLDQAKGNRELADELSTPSMTVHAVTIFRWRKQLAS
jgi:hypothetical protein